jgi:hypothetical protein
MHPVRFLAVAATSLLFQGLPVPSELAGQGGGPPVSHEHWSYDLLEALDVAGVADAWMVALRPTSRESVRGELRRVAEEGFGGERWSRLVQSWADRLDGDFPVRWNEGGQEIGGEAWVAAGLRDGEAYLDPGSGVYGELGGALLFARRFTAWGRFDTGSRERFDGLQEGGLGARVGLFSIMAGRQRIKAAGPAASSALLGGEIPLDALYIVTERPFEIPLLEWLFGRTHWQFALAPWGGIEEPEGPWLGMGSAFAEPHPRFRIGATRVVRFGGNDTAPTSPGRLLRMFFIMQNDPTQWDDQKLELWARLRWNLFGQPLATYVVLAQEDSPLWKDPGLLAGARMPIIAASGLYELAYEYTAHGKRARWCPGCTYARGKDGTRFQALWYRHARMGLFEREGIPMGNSLGGYGSNHFVSMAYWHDGGWIRGRAWGAFAIREEFNLLLERWPHKRRSGGIELAAWVRRGVELEGGLTLADGPRFDAEWGVSLRVRAVLSNQP